VLNNLQPPPNSDPRLLLRGWEYAGIEGHQGWGEYRDDQARMVPGFQGWSQSRGCYYIPEDGIPSILWSVARIRERESPASDGLPRQPSPPIFHGDDLIAF